MAEIIVTKSGTHIRGNDAFQVLRDVWKGLIEVPTSSPPLQKIETRPEMKKVVRKPEGKGDGGGKELSIQEFAKIKQIIKEATNGN